MIGLTSRTTSPSGVVSSRRTPGGAGGGGAMLIVKSASCGSSPIGSIVTERSRSRYGTLSGSVIPARQLVLVERVEDRLPAHRAVATLREAHVVLGQEDP